MSEHGDPGLACDIFVSYAREDEGRVKDLVAALERQGWGVFWDRRIPSGETWRSWIGKALDESRCVLVAWSPHAVDSNWVIEEADDGKRRGALVPVLLEAVEQPRGFREIQAADLSDWIPGRPSPRFDQLLADIGRRLGQAPAPAGQRGATMEPVAPPAAAGRAKGPIVAAGLVVLAVIIGFALLRSPSPSAPEASRGEAPARDSSVNAPPAAPAAAPSAAASAPSRGELFSKRALIDDPDGYTNVRSMPSASGEIVARIERGEEFRTYVQDGNWWQVRTQGGKVGYMHVSRIRLMN